jgi:hypothetical protein
MPDGDDISIEEKRVYAGSAGRTDVLLASADGLVRVAVSGDKVGQFSMVDPSPARDVAVLPRAAGPDRLAMATDEDLFVAAFDGDDPQLEPTGIGPSAAVGLVGPSDADAFLAATDDGGIVVVPPEASDGPGVETVGTVPDPRAVDSGLVAAGDGVYRLTSRGSQAVEAGGTDGGSTLRLEHVGLSDVRDVAGAGVPLAGTADGLYWLANGWRDALDRPIDVLAADGEGHALAAGPDGLSVHRGREWDGDSWDESDLPVGGNATALGYGPGIALAATDGGALCVDAGDGWRHQVVGVRDVSGIAVRSVE